MTVNQYFVSSYAGQGEQSLVEDLIVESIQIHGRDMYYIPRENVAFDRLYGEDKLSAFTQAYTIEMYIKNVQQFGGDHEFISKFGLEVRDEIDLTLARRRFRQEVTESDATLIRPREGDLILFPLDQRLFEISFVEDKEVFFQVGTLFTYELRCRLFELGAETFSTGIDDIDNISDYQYTKKFELISGAGDFSAGETVFQGVDFSTATFTATVLSWDSPVLVVQRSSGTETETDDITGQTSGASWSFLEADVLDSDARIVTNDSQIISIESVSAIDTSESNPMADF